MHVTKQNKHEKNVMAQVHVLKTCLVSNTEKIGFHCSKKLWGILEGILEAEGRKKLKGMSEGNKRLKEERG